MASRALFEVVFVVVLAACSASPGSERGTAQQDAPASATLTPTPNTSKPEAKLRGSFQHCVDEAAGATWPTQDCIEEEFKFQDGRLNHAYQAAMRVLSDAEKSALRSEQRHWLALREAKCPEGDDTEGQGKRLEDSYCAMERTALRADELEAVVLRHHSSPE